MIIVQQGLKIIKFRDIADGNLIYTNDKNGFVKESVVTKKALRVLKAGDVLITSAAHSGENIGKKTAYVRTLPDKLPVIYFTGELLNIRSIHFQKWIYYFFCSDEGFKEIQKAVKGVHLTSGRAALMQIPLAPLNEQKRIVEKLDAILPKVKNAKARLEKIPIIFKKFRQSVLSAACSGRLTEDWREKNNEVAAVDLSKLNKKREELQRQHSSKKGRKNFNYKMPFEISLGDKTKGIDELFELPDTWTWVTLDQVVWSISDGPHFSPQYVDKNEGVAFISSRNVKYNVIDFDDAKYISEENYQEFIKRGKPELNDVLLTKGGTTGIAHCVLVEKEFAVWVHVALLKVIKEYVDPKYLRDVLSADFVYRQSQDQTHGIGNQDLGLTRMIYMALTLPPFEEQQEIVRRVEKLFALADTLEAKYKKAIQRVEKIEQSVLAKAFKGELADPNPNDEPAAHLLNRILEEKAKLESSKKTRSKRPATAL